MEDSNSVAGAGKGFFEKTGQLKSSEQLKTEIKAAEPAKKNQTAPSTEATEFSPQTLSNAVGAVRSRFSEEANQAVSRINENEKDVKEAQQVVKDQLKVARELRDAIKAEDDGKIESKRQELGKLQDKRAKLAEKIESDQGEQRLGQRQSLNLGKDQKGIVEIKPVEFEASETDASDLDKVKDVNRFIDELKDDQDSLKVQRQDLREARREVKSIVEEVDKQITQIEGDNVRRFEDATKLAEKVAQQVRGGAQGAVASNISAAVTQRLLTS